MGLDIDLYTPKIDIDDDGADDIVIEITGLKSISKFIGLEDTPLYYDNGKFFKVEDNKIIYTDIEWKDISGNLEDAPEIVSLIKDLVEEISTEIMDNYIYLHNIAENAHPYIQNIIHENYVTLDTKIDDTKEELSQDISNLNDALNQEISDRETADNTLSEDIQEETLARIETDTTLQNNIDTLTNNLNTEIENRTNADVTLQNNIDAEVLARQNADTVLQNNINTLSQTVTDNNTAINNRVDSVVSAFDDEIETINTNLSNLSDTVSNNYTDLDGKISDLTTTVNNNDTAINNKVDGINTTLTNSINNLSDTVSSNYTILDTKIDNTKTSLEGDISDLSTTVLNNYTTLDGKITNLTSTVNDNYTELDGRITTNTNNISTINSKIPNQASSSNQLADKDFVNSSIATNTATFRGTYNSVAELEAYAGEKDNNDYAFVTGVDSLGNTYYDNYVYNGTAWVYRYRLNNSSFTAVQWTSINSGATTENINQITTNTNNIINLQTNKQDVLTAGENIQINNNVISATDTTYTAGTGISIVNGVISNTQTSAEWGNIQGTLSNQSDLQSALNAKYDASNPNGYISSASISSLTDVNLTNVANNQALLYNFTTQKWENKDVTITVDSALDNTSMNPVENRVIAQALEEISLAKNPNLNLIGGNLNIDNGNVSNFSTTDYMQFPFVFNFNGYTWTLEMGFTTGSDVTTQQNILDSYYGIAFAINNGKFLIALSSNGSSWDIGSISGTYSVQANTAYSVKISWDGNNYTLSYALDETNYTTDISIASTETHHSTQEYVGGEPELFGSGSQHPFTGTINLNKWKLIVNGLEVWLGMDDVGLGSRANIDLSNLTEAGLAKFQAPLISGINIKTINNESILGNGNIKIQAGGTVEEHYDPNSTNAQAGTAVAEAVEDTQTWVQNQGYISTLPTNLVTTDTVQDISGKKTFLGEKAIYFKQTTNTDKLGFTLYNSSGTELGALEWRPNTISGNALLALNCPQTGSNYVGFRYWSGVNIVAPRPSTNGTYFIPTHVTNGTTTVTANNNGTLNISTLLPDVSGFATQTWVQNQNYLTSISSSDVTTALGYTPYSNTNPNNYTSNVGTVTSVNNTQPDANGNVTLVIPDTASWGNITGTLSDQTDLNTALSGKQATLVSGTNIKTINNNSILGSGNLTLDGLPSQTGQSGKFLTTDGTDASWATVSIPTVDQTYDSASMNAQSGVAIAGELSKYQPVLPSQSGNNGKFLTTNGTSVSWANTTKVTFRDWSVA